MAAIIKDASGIYKLEYVASIHPVELRGNKQDQSQVTHVYTKISTVGGQTHDTTIPWDSAVAILLDFWDSLPQTPAPVIPPAPPLTEAQKLAKAQKEFGA